MGRFITTKYQDNPFAVRKLLPANWDLFLSEYLFILILC